MSIKPSLLFCAKALLVTLLAIAAPFVKTNAQTWEWATAAGAPLGTYSIDVLPTSTATDAEGNVYVVGKFENAPIVFGSTTLISHGGWDIFWAKYDAHGNLLWAKSAGGNGTDVSKSVFTDNLGHVYITGVFNSAHITLDGLTIYKNDSLGSLLSQDFVVKCNTSDGSCIWVKSSMSDLSTSYHGSCSSATGGVDAAGNVYLSGQVDSGIALLGGVPVSAIGATCIFLAKYDSTGAIQWVRSGGSVSGTKLFGCTVDKMGAIYLTGKETAPGTFGSYTITDTATTMYLLKYGSDGNVIWGQGFLNGESNISFAAAGCIGNVTTDNKGNVFVTGDIMLDTISFGATHMALPLAMGPGPSSGTLVDRTALFKFDSSGAQKWCKVVTGEIDEDIDMGMSVATDTFGNVYLAAVALIDINGTRTLDSITLISTSMSAQALILAKYDSSGNIHWAQFVDDAGSPPNTICTSPSGNLFIAGNFGAWSITLGSHTVLTTDGGGSNIMYLARLDDSISTFSLNPITGSMPLCIGTSITLSDSTTGGVWTSNDTTIAIVNSATGAVTGIAPGIVTISYSDSGATTTAIITINTLPLAGTIASTVPNLCLGTGTTLTDTATGGVWTSTDSTVATINAATGVIIGTGLGYDSVYYTVTNVCGVATTGFVVHVLASPDPITGWGHVCAGATDSLFNTTIGGTWSSSNPACISIDDASGVVTGTGSVLDIATITYSTNCGIAATAIVTVFPLPNAGAIIGADSILCAGSSISLSETATGGTWGSSNPSANVSDGVVTGMSSGADTVYYLDSTAYCGSSVALYPITVNPLPVAGLLFGPDSVCIGASVTRTPTAAGGVWATTAPATATVAGGLVTGVSVGMDTVAYTVTTATCGSATVTAAVYVGTLPGAGTISGPGSVCTGSVITLADGVTGGTWGSSATANATVSGGVVAGISAGPDTINYTVANFCGSTIASIPVTINTLPSHGTITGSDSVCVGASITLAETVTGGAWGTANTKAAIATGVVAGIAAGKDTVLYAIANMCGTTTDSLPIYIKPLAGAGTITGLATQICAGSSTTVADAASGGTWASASAGAVTTVDSVGTVTVGVYASGPDTIIYTVTNTCNTAHTTYVIYVDSALHPSITGRSYVCLGASSAADTLIGLPAGGWWSLSNFNASLNNDTLTGLSTGLDTVYYQVSNSCGMFTAAVSIWVLSAHDCDSILQVATGFGSNGNFIAIYPNPTNGIFTIELPETGVNTTISIMDMFGKVMQTKEVAGNSSREIVFDTAGLARGTYIVKTTTGGKVYINKLVVL